MKNGLFRICSMVLVIVLLINMLPLQVIAQQLNAGRDEQIQTETIQSEDNIPETKIVEEIPQKRTEYSKEYLLENGLHMINVYPEAVHYATENGWEEIDNTLIAKADGTISNTAGVWDVSFPQQLSKDKSISIKKDGYTLSFYMAGEITDGNVLMRLLESVKATDTEMVSITGMKQSAATIQTQDLSAVQQIAKHEQKMLQKIQSRLTYANVYHNTDVIYDLQSNKVKESVVLESYNSALKGYRYTLDVGTMVPVLEEDGQIIFYDTNRENIVFVMPAPYMIDAAGEHNADIQVQLTGSGSHYTMTYLLPQQWLAAEDRAWPVILDPVVQPQLTTSNIRDRTVVNQGSFSQTWGMNACGLYSNGDITRTYLKYQNLPHLTSSDVVVSATIHMYRPSDSTTVTPVFAHKVLDTWDSETISWDNMPDYNQNIEDYAIVEATGWYVWDITDVVQGWYAGHNTGVMFKTSDLIEEGEEGTNFKEFYSSDYGSNKPSLSIYFRNNNGLEDYWDYTTSSAGRAGTGYINNYTGNLIWVREDFGFSGNRMPVSIRHIYNANDAYTIGNPNDPSDPNNANNANDSAGNGFGLGNGWRTNYNQLVYQWSMVNTYYVWEDADGTDHYFLPSSDGTYKDEDGLELTLTITGAGADQVRKITDKNGNASYFDYLGRLYKIENNQETKSSITIEYCSDTRQIDLITDGAGRRYGFDYSNGLLSGIYFLDSAETIYSMTYDYEGSNLVCIYDNTSTFSEYTYDSRNLLISATDTLGYSINYTYNNAADYQPSRVLSVEERQDESLVAGKLTFGYTHNQTTITDHIDENTSNVVIYQFNNLGNTICIQDDEGHAQYYKYAINDSSTQNGQIADPTTKGNQLLESSKLQNTVSNIFWDASFEYGTPWDYTMNASVVVASSEAYYGSQSLQITAAAAGAGACEYTYPLWPGDSLTLSAYVKTGNAPASISLYNSIHHTKSERLDSDSDWTRLEVTYTNTSEDVEDVTPHILVESTGTCWADCVQMEYSGSASRYNLVENNDYEFGEFGWSSAEGLTAITTAAPQLQNMVHSITGNPAEQRWIHQEIHVSGTAGDSFVLGGWAKGNSAPLRAENDGQRQFAVQLEFLYTEGWVSEPFVAQFNPDSDDWQYSVVAAVAEQDYYSLIVSLVYDYNVNTAYFDGLQLFKEEFSTSYTYDNEGNVISATDYANQNSQYNYTGSNLDKLITPTGTGYEYVYDERNNLVLSRSSEGLQYEFTYDTYGNPLQATVGTNMYSASVTKGKTYYIRNRLSGKYMDLSGTAIVQKFFSGAETQKWEVVQNIDGSLSLKNLSNPNYGYFTASGAGSANGTAVHIYIPYHTGQSEGDRDFILKAQGLRIQPAEKYTYKILTKSGDYNTCVEVSNDNTAEGAGLVLWNWDESEAQQWYFQPVDQEPSTEIEDGSVYQFRSMCSGRYAAVNNQSSSLGALMVQYRQEGLASQKFEVNRYGDTDYYTLTPQNAPDKLLQISNGVNYAGFRYMELGDSTVTDSKLYRFEYYEPMQGFYIIPKTNEALSLEVLYSAFTDGAQLVFTVIEPLDNRMFIAEKVSDTIVSTATYSADGNQLLSTTDALGKVTTYGYDADTGLLEWVQYPEDTAATRTNYTYDGNGRLVSVSSATDTGTNQFVNYAYGGSNLSEIQSGGNFYYIDRGNFGLVDEIWAGDYCLATYFYTNDRNKYLSEVDYGNSHSVEYTYDKKGRVTQVLQDNGAVNYAYNNDGDLASIEDIASGITTRYYYDLIGRVVKQVETGAYCKHSIQYTYDEFNKLISLQESVNDDSYTSNYVYDSVNRVSSVTNGAVSEYYTYDSLSRVNQTVTKNGETGILTESYTFTSPSANATSGQIATNRLQAAGYDVTYSYTYDGNGNILSISDGTNTTSYIYDSANQLIRENNQAGGFTHTWEYSSTGNILNRKEYAYTTGELGTPLDTVTYSYDDYYWTDLLTGYDGKTVTHDGIGNTLSDGVWQYSWSCGRELASMTNGAATWHYAYDANGMRILKESGANAYHYIYNGNSLTQMDVGDDVLYFAYSANGMPMSLTYNDVVYYYVTNIQGDVIAILDAAGNLVVSYSYDAWGNPISTTGSMANTLGVLNPLRYRGYVYDQETGLYYVSSRYYDLEIGRFLNADNNFSNYNLFMYCGNNPVNRIDPNGEHWYYLWIDDLIEAVDELMASVSNIVYGRAAYERSYYDPKGANDLWNSRPFQDTKPSQEMQIFTEFMYDHDFVADISVSVDTPIKNTYVKVGVSKVLSPNKNIDASYVHAGVGASTPSVLPINISYSVGIVNGVNAKENYAKHFLDIGAGAIYGFDYCWFPNGASAYSFTIGTSYGVYGGYDYYWCLD